MLGASGAMLQAGESAAGATAEGGGAQAATSGGGVSSIMGEIGDEDSKGRAGDLGGDELGGGGDRGFLGGGSGANRWPRQETLALLKIRSDMDVVFRDSSLKGPLWEEVSRKMADHGYHRSAKKCKEKFENVYKYHKRTKEGRAAKSDGKTYRFFDQLQALETHSMLPPPPALPPPPPAQAAVPISMAMPPPQQPPSIPAFTAQITVTSTNQVPVPHSTVGQQSQHSVQPAISAPIQHIPPQQVSIQNANAVSFQSSPSETPSSSETSSTSSDEEIHGMRRKRKRKWKDFFERLMKTVIGKQEDLQQKFLEEIEKREHDRMVREEAWKVQEMARLNREHDILVQERSMAAAKDAALISFLQKLSNQQQIPLPPPVIQPIIQPQPRTPTQTPTPSPIQTPIPAPVQLPQTQELKNTNAAAIVQVSAQPQQLEVSLAPARTNNGDPSHSYLPAASSSRWPKTEVEDLINLRTILDQKYQETGPKGPLWEEISSEMKKLGYNRNAKRCKEKWENINKYFKKVKESNKKRPEDSKTCPYFHQLDVLYRQKNKVDPGFGSYAAAKSHHLAAVAPVAAGVEAIATPIMVQPEQQWPPQRDHDRDEEDDEEDEDEDEDDQGEGYEIVANTNNGTSMGGAAAASS